MPTTSDGPCRRLRPAGSARGPSKLQRPTRRPGPPDVDPETAVAARRLTTAIMASPASAQGASGAPDVWMSTTQRYAARDEPPTGPPSGVLEQPATDPRTSPAGSAVVPELHHVSVRILEVHRRAL